MNLETPYELKRNVKQTRLKYGIQNLIPKVLCGCRGILRVGRARNYGPHNGRTIKWPSSGTKTKRL